MTIMNSTLHERSEAETLREVFADDATIVANAIADLLTPREPVPEPEKPPLGPLARALAAVEAEEVQYGPLFAEDRRRTRILAATSGLAVDVIRHVLRVRENERRRAARRG